MTVKNAARDVLAAMNVLRHAGVACADLKPLSLPMTDLELQQRAHFIDAVLRTRYKLKLSRARAAGLEGALVRFKDQREARRA